MTPSVLSPQSSPLSLLVMAGGTGGHVYPALAVAQEARQRGWRVTWLGTRAGMEARIAPRHGFDMTWISMSGIRRSGIWRIVALPFMLLVAFVQSLKAILRIRPDVVLGMGGYSSFPGGMMAALLGKPLVIHEQNAVAGLANRVLACVADRVLVAFPMAFEAGRRLPCRGKAAEWVGNPVRSGIGSSARTPHQGRLRLLVVGGSLGAQALNEAVPGALALMPAERRPLVIHQAGEKHLATLQANYAAAAVEADTRAFIDDMAAAYAWADLAIARAGALTIAELAVAGLPAILVPYPFAVDDHQTANARFLADAGAAVLLPQAQLSARALADLIAEFDRERLALMAAKARACARVDSTVRVADICAEQAS